MTETHSTAAVLVDNMPSYCPVTNLYQCSDGKYLLVTVKSPIDVEQSLESLIGQHVPISRSHAPRGTEVFLADERGRVLDADEDLANGMTPLEKFPPGTTHVSALAQMGYEVTDAG